jgi:hypothetical protein
MPPKATRKEKKSKRRYGTKLSQKVIQKVVVQVNQDRQAKKARRKQRKTYKKEFEALQAQQFQSTPANITYATGLSYQPLQLGQTLITPEPRIIGTSSSRRVPQFVDVEEASGIIEVPLKREQLETFITPVERENDPTSRIYSERIFNPETIQGNYAFGKFDESVDRPPSSLYDNETLIAEPTKPMKFDPEVLLPLTREELEPVTAIAKAARRSKEEILASRQDELYFLYTKLGYSKTEALTNVSKLNSKELVEEIKKAKKEVKARPK